MDVVQSHITSYKTLGYILLTLLLLTCITINVTSYNLEAWNVAIVLIIAATKSYLVMTYFMHLKYESRIIRAFVIVVVCLFITIFLITFIDYLFR